ncbi:MAG: tetratricopeptide repeat protein [Candidatus Riflebacteria bacterium]|nr:tetratricopeptide repeat protein [Candidatus Riflebacteria bacterium]
MKHEQINSDSGFSSMDSVVEHIKNKKWKKALLILEREIDQSTSDPRAYFFAGLAYTATKKLEKGIQVLKEAIRLKPDYASAYAALSSIHIKMGDFDAAMETFNNQKVSESSNDRKPAESDGESTNGNENGSEKAPSGTSETSTIH